MTATMSRNRVYNLLSMSQAHKDVTDERYRDLRRPRKVRFFVNGDRYFKGKKLYITPHRYFNFNDLLNDLTGKLPNNLNLPYGVRQIFTPSGGRRITDIEDLSDGSSYVCAGFEGYKTIRYGKAELEPWSLGDNGKKTRPHQHDLETEQAGYAQGFRHRAGMFGSNGFHPGRYFHGQQPTKNRWGGTFGHATKNSYLSNTTEHVPLKPKVVTIVRNGPRPRNNVKILLNRRSVQSYDQLMSDIAEAFGPKYKTNRLKKLFNVKGKEVHGISDFFRDDDVFIGVGNDSLTEGDIQDIIEELYPDSPYARNLLRDLEKQRKKRQAALKDSEADKRDSGFGEGSDGSNRDQEGDYIIYKGRPQEKGRRRHDYPKEDELAMRLDKDRMKAAQEDRDRTKRQQKKMIESERRALENEKRKQNQVPTTANKPEDPFKRMKEQKEKEREEIRKRREDERQARIKEEEAKEREKREKAEHAARERQAAAEKAELEKGDKEKAEHEKPEKQKEKADNKSDKEDNDKDLHKKRKSKSKIVRKTKLERQVSSDEHVLSRYELGRTLGDGNFAIVRQAKLKNSNSEYAMKVIDKHKLKGKEHMVENEIEIMKDCHQPNIVKLYEEYETHDKIYLVMELVKGGDLFDAITQSVKFGEVDSAHMVKDLCNALFYLHSRSIVHRDLKPENLLVHRNKDGTISIKLADFGLAMEVKEDIYTVCGTPTYVAPEILSEIGYGLEVDMWAVGVISYILLCGFPPFRSPDRNQTELFEFIKAGEYEFLSPYWDNISSSAKDMIEHLLVVDRKRRFNAIDTLSHPWIITSGDTSHPQDNAKIEEMRRNARKDLELQARLALDSYQKQKEKRLAALSAA
ncbi:serine/threonine-protein kinase DCLK3-like isoform X3 [Mytilus galloprovincialis]|uniref:serine/threonine-protein kinase DCLK3-like isoform X3 n=1 Tax=Mytilus galloprovincialis TaxID=29158 RepID=UPI003F7C796D